MKRYNSNNSNARNEPGYGRISDSKVYVGIVKNNSDVQKMGRLEVYIAEFGGDPSDRDRWFIVSYASPFAGVSNIDANVDGSQSLDGTQTSYGLWMIPPDLNNQVLVVFINGEPTKGVWFACLWQQNMNHMVPGVSSNLSYQEDGSLEALPPVAEYNKKDHSTSFTNTRRPRFEPLHSALLKQGLYSDFERGPSSSSARRESPSKVFGLLSPRGNQLYIDDNQLNEFIRMRTRSGVQVLLHETNGYIYLNSGDGNSWVEISDAGVNVYTAGNMSFRAEMDVNIRADRNLNLDAGGDINIKTNGTAKMISGGDMHVSAVGSINESSKSHHMKAEQINRDGFINDNAGLAMAAKQPSGFSRADRTGSFSATVSVLPTHEPWDGHPRSKNLEPPKGDIPGEVSDIKGTGGQLTDVEPYSYKESGQQTKEQTTGEGEVKDIPYSTDTSTGTVKVGGHTVSEGVIAAIRRACEITGVDFGFMMAMAEKESSFNPKAIPLNKKTGKTYSSAKGLYQILDKTWNNLYKSYGARHSIPDDRFDPFANALMAGYLTRENRSALIRYGVQSPNNTHLYMAHFCGPWAAAKVAKGDPNATGEAVIGAKAAKANPWVFYNKGTPRTCKQIFDLFSKFIEPRSVAYRNVGSGIV